MTSRARWNIVRVIVTMAYLMAGWVLFTWRLSGATLILGLIQSLIVALLTFPIFIEEDEVTEICLRFDVIKAIHYSEGNGYMMHPAYQTYKCDGSDDSEDQDDSDDDEEFGDDYEDYYYETYYEFDE